MKCIRCLKEVPESIMLFIETEEDKFEPVCPDCIEAQVEADRQKKGLIPLEDIE